MSVFSWRTLWLMLSWLTGFPAYILCFPSSRKRGGIEWVPWWLGVWSSVEPPACFPERHIFIVCQLCGESGGLIPHRPSGLFFIPSILVGVKGLACDCKGFGLPFIDKWWWTSCSPGYVSEEVSLASLPILKCVFVVFYYWTVRVKTFDGIRIISHI